MKKRKNRKRFYISKSGIRSEIDNFDNECREIIILYIECEKIVRKIIENVFEVPKSNFVINTKDLKTSFKVNHFAISDDVINILFNTNYKNNKLCSLRKIRNKLFHRISNSSIRTLRENKTFYKTALTEFLDCICDK